MAGSADTAPNQELVMAPDAVRDTAARLYGQGFARKEIAVALLSYLAPENGKRDRAGRLKLARAKLRHFEQDPTFRDKIWELSLIQTDIQSGRILNGLVQKARRGRVDAAKLALELTGRYTPKGEQAPTQVAVVFTGINRAIPTAVDQIEAEAEEV